MNFSTLQTSLEKNIFIITINRPDKLNALNKKVLDELNDAVQEIYNDTNIHAAIITWAGNKAFVAGADIAKFTALKDDDGKLLAKKGQDIFFKIENCPKPVIAAVNGFALGGGCELALSCSMRIASKNARLGQPEVKLGIIPGYGGSQRLARLCGKGIAHELILTGEMIPAEEALRIGLVNRVVELADLIPTAETIAKKIIANAPLAVKFSMDAIEQGTEMPQEAGLFLEATLFGLCCATEDMREGTRAFVEKRPAQFKGK